MKKAKNILLLSGVCLYVFNQIFDLWCIVPQNDEITKYTISTVVFVVINILLCCSCPTILLFLNLKGKRSKVFAIIISILSVLSAICIVINGISTVPQYLILSKLGFIDTYLIYLLPSGGLISFILITVGAILSCKENKE